MLHIMVYNNSKDISESLLAEEQRGLGKSKLFTDSALTLKLLIKKVQRFHWKTHIAFFGYTKALHKLVETAMEYII